MWIIKKYNKKLYVVGCVLLFCILLYTYYKFHEKVIVTSDNTTMLPLLKDWIEGNFLLRNWIVGTNNFFFTETIWCMLGLLLGMDSIDIVYFIPAIFFVGFLFFSSYFFIWENATVDKRVKRISMFVFFAVIGIVPISSSYALLNLNSHNGLYLFIILEIVLVLEYLKKPGNIRYIFLYIVVGIGVCFSDGMSLMILIAPVVGFSCYNCFFEGGERRKSIIIFCSSIIMYFIAKLCEILLENTGGMITRGIPIQITSFDMIPQRLKGFFRAGKGFLGFSISNNLYWGIMIVLGAFFVYSFVLCLIKIFFHKIEKETLIIWLTIAFNLIGCLCTNVAIVDRYIAPTYLFGGLLSCIELSNILKLLGNKALKYAKVIICLCMFIIAGARISENIRAPKLGMEEKKVVAFLEENNYGNGYADFWCGSVLSSYSNFEIEIYPIWSNADMLSPYDELINKDWYREKNIHYIIMNADDSQNAFCKKRQVIEILGIPQEENIFGKYEILYWNKDISDYICSN